MRSRQAIRYCSGDQAADAQSSAVVPPQPDKPLSGKELRRQKKEAAAAQKAEAAAQKAREKAEAEAQKARQKEESLAAKLQRRQEKKEYRQGVRQERGQEIRLLWHIVEFIMLVTFIVLAIDQVGLYGFLFVWFFIALAAASIVLLLAGLIRAFRKKRAGIMILVSLIGIIGCIAWFIFLGFVKTDLSVPERKLGESHGSPKILFMTIECSQSVHSIVS